MVEGLQLLGRTAVSLGRRLHSGASYPGLQQLIEGFYRSVSQNGQSPVSPEHLLRVTDVFEQLVGMIQKATQETATVRPRASMPKSAPRVILTGARGFLGAELARALHAVRGIGRGPHPDNPHVRDWVSADLADGLTVDALAGAHVVVHAAAETAGGYDAHQRNSIDATRQLLTTMKAAGVTRLVLVSSLSVLRPPRMPWERQNESTPRSDEPKRFGPYVWGKSQQEQFVEQQAPRLGIAVRIVRPGALVDWSGLPGLMGRHLYGPWHLGLGRPSLPIAVCDVGRCADAIAWCATHFDQAPSVVNLFDPAFLTRGAFIEELRRRGWRGRVVWVPISAVSIAFMTARTLVSLVRGRLPERLAVWSVLRPRRYDARLTAAVLEAATTDGSECIAIGA
jgi:nucleoside-diphosphate-sugar epimerase